MKSKRPLARALRYERLEGRQLLSVIPGWPTGAAVTTAHSKTAAQVAKSNTTTAPISTVSSNWSGYAVTGATDSVSYVAGTWVVPTVSTKSNGYSSAWVGIDGYNSSTVEQIGTDADVVNGKATYYAWYEMYPSASITITTTNDGKPFTVNPGDTITGSVAYVSGSFVLTITDGSEVFSTTLAAAGASRSSAEWVVEAPSSTSGILTLANFGTTTFTNAYATIAGVTGPIDNWQAYSIKLESRSTVLSSASSLTDSSATSLPTGTADTYAGDVSSFTVTYSGSTSTTSPTPPTRTGGGGGWGGGWGRGGGRGGWGQWGGNGSWRQTELAATSQTSTKLSTSVGQNAVRDQFYASLEGLESWRLRV
jgi:hypothetical protein